MRKLFKKAVAITAAFAMTLSVATVASAEDPSPDPSLATGGSVEGDSQLEGYVNKDVYKITVPTLADGTMDFTLDPQGLLGVADATKWDDGVGAVYFKNAPATEYTEKTGAPSSETLHYVLKADGTYELYNAGGSYDDTNYTDYADGAFTKYYEKNSATYSNTSDKLTIANDSSFDIKVGLKVKLNNTQNIALVESSALASAQAPSLYLGLITDSGAATAITAPEATFTPVDLAAAPTAVPADPGPGYTKEGYELKAVFDDDNENASPNGYVYSYGLSAGYVLGSNAKVEYQLTGKCDSIADWSKIDTDVLSAEVVWTVTADELTPPEPDPVAPSIETTTGTYSKASGAAFDVDLGVGNLAAEGIAKLEISADNSAFSSYGGDYTFENGTLTLASGYMGGATAGSTRYVKVTFDDDAATAVVLTLTVAN